MKNGIKLSRVGQQWQTGADKAQIGRHLHPQAGASLGQLGNQLDLCRGQRHLLLTFTQGGK